MWFCMWLPTIGCLMFSHFAARDPMYPFSLSFKKSWKRMMTGPTWITCDLDQLLYSQEWGAFRKLSVLGGSIPEYSGGGELEVPYRMMMVVSEEAENVSNSLGNKHPLWMSASFFLVNFNIFLHLSTGHLTPRNFVYSLLTLSPNNGRVWQVSMSAEGTKDTGKVNRATVAAY